MKFFVATGLTVTSLFLSITQAHAHAGTYLCNVLEVNSKTNETRITLYRVEIYPDGTGNVASCAEPTNTTGEGDPPPSSPRRPSPTKPSEVNPPASSPSTPIVELRGEGNVYQQSGTGNSNVTFTIKTGGLEGEGTSGKIFIEPTAPAQNDVNVAPPSDEQQNYTPWPQGNDCQLTR